MSEKIVVIGLGYVGLPLALAFAKKFPQVIGFDIDEGKIRELKEGTDVTGETDPGELRCTKLICTTREEDIRGADFYIITVPTPIDIHRCPDLNAVEKATATVARVLKKGSIVVYESTVYPGVTEDLCGPIIEKISGLKHPQDFKLGYSPERINPGDKEHTVEKIVKVVAGEDAESLEAIAQLYGTVIKAGVHRTSTIRVAEAAKAIENTQRDLNIALMNELALIFDLMGISTRDVLAAAGTKWNFLPFRPGLVGGHCIGVDPYYLTTKAEELGYHPQVILAGRKINDDMGFHLGRRLIKLLVNSNVPVKGAKVAILGLTFKENVADLRNSRVPDIVKELREFGIEPLVHDPLAARDDAQALYNIKLSEWYELGELDAIVIAVSHREYFTMNQTELLKILKPQGVIMDVKSMLTPEKIPGSMIYWSL
jgi:UDP-N-acetyl-D-galactosamine dehydrogenase